MVLGIHWLSQLRPVVWDFAKLSMQFQYKGEKVKLRGIAQKKLKSTQSQKINKLLHPSGELAMLQLIPVAVGHTPQISTLAADQKVHSPGLIDVLEQYSEVFKEPQGLPPVREQFDHKIPLKEGTDAINLRPYRYSTV